MAYPVTQQQAHADAVTAQEDALVTAAGNRSAAAYIAAVAVTDAALDTLVAAYADVDPTIPTDARPTSPDFQAGINAHRQQIKLDAGLPL